LRKKGGGKRVLGREEKKGKRINEKREWYE